MKTREELIKSLTADLAAYVRMTAEQSATEFAEDADSLITDIQFVESCLRDFLVDVLKTNGAFKF